MSDHDAAPDPIDKAYAEAEALIEDDAARAARRAGVLAAVAHMPATALPAAAPARRRAAWGRGGWLAAAGVAGLSLFVATQIYRPVRRPPPVAATASGAPSPGATTSKIASAPEPSTAAAPIRARAPAARAAPPPSAVRQPPAAPAPILPPAPLELAPQPFPAATPPPPPPPPPPPQEEVAVTAGRRAPVAPAAQSSEASDRSADGQLATRGFAGRSSGLVAPPGSPSRDPAVRLRAAAAIGLTAEIETLLAQGVPVDAPDRDGDTALMKAIQADRPAAAALLRKHGASLDRKNRAGVSARDMAGARADPALDEAIGQNR